MNEWTMLHSSSSVLVQWTVNTLIILATSSDDLVVSWWCGHKGVLAQCCHWWLESILQVCAHTCCSTFSYKILFVFQPLDFESKRTHNVVVEAVNKHVDPRFVDLGSFRDQTIVRVSVLDIDEPPLFQPAEGAIMEVQEDAKVGAQVGIITARDPDVKNKPVRYDKDQLHQK